MPNSPEEIKVEKVKSLILTKEQHEKNLTNHHDQI